MNSNGRVVEIPSCAGKVSTTWESKLEFPTERMKDSDNRVFALLIQKVKVLTLSWQTDKKLLQDMFFCMPFVFFQPFFVFILMPSFFCVDVYESRSGSVSRT